MKRTSTLSSGNGCSTAKKADSKAAQVDREHQDKAQRLRKPRQGNADEASCLHKEINMSAIHQPGTTNRIIMGIDPGVAIVGYAVVEAQGDALRMIVCDVIRSPAGGGDRGTLLR